MAEKVGCDVDVRGSEGLRSITFGAPVVTEFLLGMSLPCVMWRGPLPHVTAAAPFLDFW